MQDSEQAELIYELACLWARYDVEDFGARSYLSELLNEERLEDAKRYYKICQQYIKNSPIDEWQRAPELVEHKEWFAEQKVEKKKSYLREKPNSKSNNDRKKRNHSSKKKVR